jgi:hypothetical protein
MYWYTSENNEMKQEINHILAGNPTGHPNGKTFLGIFINDIQYSESSPISRAINHKIIAPDMVLSV